MACNLKELKKDSAGSVSFSVGFFYLSIITLVLFAVFVPFLQTMDIALYEAGEDILERGKGYTSEINDANVRVQFDASLDAQTDSIVTQVEILSVFFQYGWILIILIIVLVLFIATRKSIEIGVR